MQVAVSVKAFPSAFPAYILQYNGLLYSFLRENEGNAEQNVFSGGKGPAAPSGPPRRALVTAR